MSDLLELKQDLKEIKAEIKTISSTLVINTEQLKTHMMRTVLNEKRIDRAENWTFGLLSSAIIALVGNLLKKFF